MISKATSVAMALLILALVPLSAEEGLGYDELVGSMVSLNTELRKADQAVVQSGLDVKNAKAQYSPAIDLTVSGTYMPNPPIGRITMSVEELQGQLGTAIPGAGAGEYVTLYDGMGNFMFNAGVSITQPLFTWGKIPESVDLYKAIADIRAIDRSDKEERLSSELSARLCAMRYMEEMLILLDEASGLADELLSISEDAYESGMILREDLAEARLGKMELDVSRKEIEGEASKNMQAIGSITGLEGIESSDIIFEVDEAYIDAVSEMDEEELFRSAFRGDSASLRMLSKQTEALMKKKEIADDSVYWKPDFALQVSASYGGEYLPFAEKNWYRGDDYGLYVTLAMKTTLWDGGKALNNIKSAESEITASYADYDAAVDMLQQSARESITAMKLSKARIEYLELKKETAQSRLDILRMQLEEGWSSRMDILKKEMEIKEYEIGIMKERISLSQAVYTLSYLSGI
ncbi:MAG: TolC family protein [Candidatus Ornithospirochaeta sp.]|nr:TolC family protein [Candidatus Ornithospirochaeta sp.]